MNRSTHVIMNRSTHIIMNRTTDIIQILQNKIPYHIIIYILQIEKDLNFIQSQKEWKNIYHIFRQNLSTKFFYDYNRKLHLKEIKSIKGNFKKLKKYQIKIWNLKRECNNYSLYLNSLRYI